MSIQTIIRRCDHPGCVETFDQTVHGNGGGWAQVIADVFPGAVRAFWDYCPDHRDEHGPTDAQMATERYMANLRDLGSGALCEDVKP